MITSVKTLDEEASTKKRASTIPMKKLNNKTNPIQEEQSSTSQRKGKGDIFSISNFSNLKGEEKKEDDQEEETEDEEDDDDEEEKTNEKKNVTNNPSTTVTKTSKKAIFRIVRGPFYLFSCFLVLFATVMIYTAYFTNNWQTTMDTNLEYYQTGMKEYVCVSFWFILKSS